MTAAGQVGATGQVTDRRRRSAVGMRSNPVSPVVVAEVALAFLTVASIIGLGRLYRTGSFAGPLIVLAVGGHALAAFCRRRRLPSPAVAVIAVVAGGVGIAWLFFGQSTVLGVPTPHTFALADGAVRSAWNRFGVVVAPAPVLPGFQVVAALAVWAGIWFADWAAFRLWAAAESLAPAAVVFVFGSMLGAPRHRVSATLLFAAAALGFMLVHRVARQELTSTWIAATPGAGRRSLLQTGATLGAVALLGGALVGPHVPGAGRSAVLPWRQSTGPADSRITVSPLVDIRKRLVDQSNQEAFNVRSNRASYWRLTSLDTFDGRIWSSGGSFTKASGQLSQNQPAARRQRKIVQQFEIGALSAIWVPAAFEATSVDPGDTQMRWDPTSSTLIVDDDRSTSDGFLYTVVSEIPEFSPSELHHAGPGAPADIRRDYLKLPGNFNRQVTRLARSVTATAIDQYQRALLLQNWFRDNFTYDLAVPAGHSEDAIAEFLRSRRGYCEQFAGTYAAMARSIGLPSRVAVGFTQGDVDPSDPDLYRVKGKHAHAWPEVWFEGVGWVPFEPTPGRGAPDAMAYTGVRARQASSQSNQASGTTLPGSTSPPSTQPATPKLDPKKFNLSAEGSAATAHRHRRRLTDNPLVVTLLALALAALAYLLVVLGFPVLRRRRAHRHAVTDGARIALAWDEASEAVACLGSSLPYASETHHEYAARVSMVLGPAAPDHRELASVACESAWSGRNPAAGKAERAEALSSAIRQHVDQRMSGRDRTRARLDPRRLVRPRPPARPASASTRSGVSAGQ